MTRWYPGVVNEIVEEVHETEKTVTTTEKRTKRRTSIQDALLAEAQVALELKRQLQTEATQSKSMKELMQDLGDIPDEGTHEPLKSEATRVAQPKKRRVRHKMRSTPVFGGSLFGEETTDNTKTMASEQKQEEPKDSSFATFDAWKRQLDQPSGQSGEITIEGETFNIRITDETLKNLRKGYNGFSTTDGRGMIGQGLTIDTANAPVVNMLQGFVRNQQLTNIKEEHRDEAVSEVSSN